MTARHFRQFRIDDGQGGWFKESRRHHDAALLGRQDARRTSTAIVPYRPPATNRPALPPPRSPPRVESHKSLTGDEMPPPPDWLVKKYPGIGYSWRPGYYTYKGYEFGYYDDNRTGECVGTAETGNLQSLRDTKYKGTGIAVKIEQVLKGIDRAEEGRAYKFTAMELEYDLPKDEGKGYYIVERKDGKLSYLDRDSDKTSALETKRIWEEIFNAPDRVAVVQANNMSEARKALKVVKTDGIEPQISNYRRKQLEEMGEKEADRIRATGKEIYPHLTALSRLMEHDKKWGWWEDYRVREATWNKLYLDDEKAKAKET